MLPGRGLLALHPVVLPSPGDSRIAMAWMGIQVRMMTIDFTQPVLFDQPNNGYMVTMKELPPATNGGPNYEVMEGYPNWPDVQAWLAAGNKAQPYVPPAPVLPRRYSRRRRP